MKTSRTVLARTLAGRLGDKKLAEETAAYLLSEKRVGELDSLLRDMEQYRTDHDGVVEVEAVSAFDLSAEVQAEIRAKIRAIYPAAKQIIITERHDPSVIGGVRLLLANQQLDLSIRAKLNHFKELTATGRK